MGKRHPAEDDGFWPPLYIPDEPRASNERLGAVVRKAMQGSPALARASAQALATVARWLNGLDELAELGGYLWEANVAIQAIADQLEEETSVPR